MESPSTDAQLVAATLSGSLSAFEALVLRHQDRLYLQALRYMRAKEEAQDALQDAFLKAFNQLENLQEHSRFPSWMSQILRNICLNRLRDNRRRQAMSVVEVTYPGEQPEQPVIRNAAFEELLSRLPAKSAQAFILHYLEGYSIQDVALQKSKITAIRRGFTRSLEKSKTKLRLRKPRIPLSPKSNYKSEHDLPIARR